MKTNFISFQSEDNIKLTGLHYTSKNQKLVIYLHGSHSSIFTSPSKIEEIAQVFSKHNIDLLAFDNRGSYSVRSHKRNYGTEEEERIMSGSSFELIKDCKDDIEGAINYSNRFDYKELFLAGHSTGANKIVVYDKLTNGDNRINKYILLAGGDDTGLFYKMIGKDNFEDLLDKSRKKVNNGDGEDLYRGDLLGDFIYSYQSLYDTINPEGYYNIFPFLEYSNKLNLSQKELFKEFKSIDKPTLVIYGSEDEYCYPDANTAVHILKKQVESKSNFSFIIIPNTDHSFTNKSAEIADKMTSFIKND